MEITSLVEQNPTLLRLGLHLEYNDARHRIATHLQRNIDTSKCRALSTVLLQIFLFLYILLDLVRFSCRSLYLGTGSFT